MMMVSLWCCDGDGNDADDNDDSGDYDDDDNHGDQDAVMVVLLLRR